MHAYANAMWSMLPTRDHLTPPSSRSADPLTSAAPFEPTNDLHVHRLTHPQLFVPVPESKPFTRVDAAREFHPSLLPADARVPLAGLVEAEREALRLRQSGPSATKGRRDGTGTSEVDVEALRARFWEREREEERLAAEREAKEREARERRITRVVVGGEDASIGESESADATATGRKHRRPVEYRFEEIRVEDGGRFGRSRKGTGMRYGVPFDDRKKGKVKIPTSVG